MHFDIELLVDHATRESLFLEIVKSKLEQKGMKVSIDHQDFFVSPKGYDFFVRTNKRTTLIVTPSFHVFRTRTLLAKAIRQGACVVCLHSEQLYPEIYLKEKLNLSYPKTYKNVVKRHLVWGRFFQDILVNKLNIEKDKVKVVGNYKLDFANDEKSYRSTKSILAVSNFVAADHTVESWKRFKSKHYITTNYDLPAEMTAIRAEFIENIQLLASKVPNYNIVLRPHPGEDLYLYEENFKSTPNVTVRLRGEIYQEMKMCDLVVMHSSSSIFEAINMGKRCISIGAKRVLENFAQTPIEIFEWRKVSEVVRILERQEFEVPEYQEVIANKLFYKDEMTSIDKTVNALTDIHDDISNNRLRIQRTPLVVLIYFFSIAESLSKDMFIKFGCLLKRFLGINVIYNFARNHLRRRVRKINFIPRRYTTKNLAFQREIVRRK